MTGFGRTHRSHLAQLRLTMRMGAGVALLARALLVILAKDRLVDHSFGHLFALLHLLLDLFRLDSLVRPAEVAVLGLVAPTLRAIVLAELAELRVEWRRASKLKVVSRLLLLQLRAERELLFDRRHDVEAGLLRDAKKCRQAGGRAHAKEQQAGARQQQSKNSHGSTTEMAREHERGTRAARQGTAAAACVRASAAFLGSALGQPGDSVAVRG